MKKTLILRQPQNNSIKLHTNNQPPSLLNFGDSYEEDLRITICKTILPYFEFFLSIFFLIMLISSYIPKILYLGRRTDLCPLINIGFEALKASTKVASFYSNNVLA